MLNARIRRLVVLMGLLLLRAGALHKIVTYRDCHPRMNHKPASLLVRLQKPLKMESTAENFATAPLSIDTKTRNRDLFKLIWNFSRPHTVLGSAVSIISLFMFTVSPSAWASQSFLVAIFRSMVPSIFMNLYITGLNQVTDVKVDKINKPYLPIASGALSYRNGIVIVICSLVASIITSWGAEWPLLSVLFGSFLLGTMYSIPPVRLKRFPLLAASCIFVVRGSLVNLGFIWQAKKVVCSVDGGPIYLLSAFPESIIVTAFFAMYGFVIAIMKDVPDIEGDSKFQILTFSVKRGAHRMFQLSYNLLFGLLVSASFMNSGVLIFTAALRGGIGALNILCSAVFSIMMASFALYLRKKAYFVRVDNIDEVYLYYMDVWKIFYACYALLPLLHSVT